MHEKGRNTKFKRIPRTMQGFTWPEGMEMSLPGGDIRALPGLLGARKKGHILKKSSPKCAEGVFSGPDFKDYY